MCYVWSIGLYGAGTWTLRATDQKHLESLKCGAGEEWRRSVGPDHGRNEEVLLRVNEQGNILHEIIKRKANWDWSHLT